MKEIIQIASYIVLLGFSVLLGLLGKTAEMGLSIVAGVLGLAFANIDKMSRFKGAGFEAEMREQISTVVEKETEPVIEDSSGLLKIEAYGTDEKTKQVIEALKNPRYTWRHINGIIRETGLTKNEVESSLGWLLETKLGKKSIGPQGNIWSLTSKGRSVFQSAS